jgi:hypothetical protein
VSVSVFIRSKLKAGDFMETGLHGWLPQRHVQTNLWFRCGGGVGWLHGDEDNHGGKAKERGDQRPVKEVVPVAAAFCGGKFGFKVILFHNGTCFGMVVVLLCVDVG